MKKKILLTFGTRPEAIKMAPLFHKLTESGNFDIKVCVTAQHRQMLDQVLDVFNITPDIDLDLMKDGQDLFDITAFVLLKMRDVLKVEKPDIVLVHGDTTTAFATALAAFYHGILIGHVEAGLRTFDLKAPFPEEFNRQLIGRIANIHFAPTKQSQENLLSENVDPKTISITGNTVIDALHWVLKRLGHDLERSKKVKSLLDAMLCFPWQKAKIILITGHRRENFGDGFSRICHGVKALAKKFPEVHFVYPVHLNPAVQQPVASILGCTDNVHLIAPLEYEPFVLLMKHAHIILTDSGGIQEEAPSLGKPVIVMREVTERPEAVLAGTVKLVGTDEKKLVQEISKLLEDQEYYEKMLFAHNPYGDGNACDSILSQLKEILC